MNNVLFTSPAKLKESGIIDNNIQEQDILVSIRKVQTIKLQTVLGTNLYDKITSEIQGIISPKNKVLLDNYIFDAIAYLVKADLQLELSFRTRSTGLQSTLDETKQNAYLSEIKYIKKINDDTAQFYLNRLREFLEVYSSDYPEYKTQRDNSDMKPTSGIKTGLNL